MRLVTTLRGVSYLAVAAVGFALGGRGVIKKKDDVVIATQPSRHYGQATGEQTVSLTQRVSYSDLDLSTYSGAKQLELRVHQVANTLCDELERRTLSLSDSGERRACVNGAVADGMEHARAAIAAAEKRLHVAG